MIFASTCNSFGQGTFQSSETLKDYSYSFEETKRVREVTNGLKSPAQAQIQESSEPEIGATCSKICSGFWSQGAIVTTISIFILYEFHWHYHDLW